MISYNEIYEAARKERYSEQLQPLSKKFIQDVSDYLKDKKEIASRQEDIFSDVIVKTKKQLENAMTIFKELMRMRRKKLLNLVLVAAETGISKQDFDNMLTIEKEMFEEIMKSIDISDRKLSEALNGKKEVEEANELVSLRENIDEFVGFDGSKIGPFVKGQIANLPKAITKILVEDGKAEVMDIGV